METLAALLFLATFIEGTLTYAAGENTGSFPRRYLQYIAMAMGIALAAAYALSIPEILGLTSGVFWVDYIITGVIIGRGSNYLNDLMQNFS